MQPYDRPVAQALDVLVSHRVVAGLPTGMAEVTALRERVEDAVVGALEGVEIDDMPLGWDVDEAMEQVAMHTAMDFMFEELNPAVGSTP